MRTIFAQAFLVCFGICLASPLAAQRAPGGGIEGQVMDSVHSAPLAGAVVSATSLGAARETTFVTTTDRRGRFRFDSLEAGRYAMRFESAMLDSLQYGGTSTQVSVTPRGTARVQLAIPSGETLRATACPGVGLSEGNGVLLGLVADAETGRPLVDAQVAVGWSDLEIDASTRAVVTDERAAHIAVDASGQYRLCGLPTDDPLLVQVQHAGRAGPVLHMTIPNGTGVLVRDISFSVSGARLFEDGAEVPERAPLLTGTAKLAGIVRDVGGRPVAGAQVRVLGTAGNVRTDERGAYAIANLPAGTHELEVRQLGFGTARGPVELRHDQRTRLDVQLERVVTLASIGVVARRWRYPEFEQRRKDGFGARFLDETEIKKLNLHTTSDVVNALPGFRAIHERWGATRFISMRDGSCQPVVLVDDLPISSLTDLPTPTMLGAIEVYQGTAGAPMSHRSPCGTIVFWTKR
jgi:hypothetical protein